jgi:hypothetical protein
LKFANSRIHRDGDGSDIVQPSGYQQRIMSTGGGAQEFHEFTAALGPRILSVRGHPEPDDEVFAALETAHGALVVADDERRAQTKRSSD